MQAALDVTVPYVHERHQFGSPIGHFQVSFRLSYSKLM
jgi:isovaleryl-CoA dehydrogenase